MAYFNSRKTQLAQSGPARSSKTAYDCVKELYLNEELSDMRFEFPCDQGKNKGVPVHKFILSMRSDVFKAMFYGPMAKDESVQIEDVDQTAMSEVLRYIYRDEVQLNGNNVMMCLYAAKKYQIQGLVSRCEDFLKKSICPTNVCTIYEQAKFYNTDKLTNVCFSYIIQHARKVLQNDDFLQLSSHSVSDVLERDLQVNEIELFLAVYRWGEHKCRRVKEEVTGLNVRNQLGDILYKIRFPLLTSEQFAALVSPKDILTQEEELLIFRHLARAEQQRPGSSVGRFSSQRRGPQKGRGQYPPFQTQDMDCFYD